LYLQVFNWPKDGKLVVPFSNKITKAYLLVDSKTKLKVTVGKDKSIIQLPAYAPDPISSVIAVEFEGIPVVQGIPSQGAKLTATSTSEGLVAGNINDGDPKNKWQAAKGEKSATIEIDLGSKASIQCISLVEPWHPWSGMSQKMLLSYFDGKVWVPLLKEIVSEGTGLTLSFEPVTAQKFKLAVQNSKTEPAINELILFRAE